MKLPQKNKRDIAHTTIKAFLSAIPGPGGPLAEIFNYLIAPPIEKRRDKWLEDVIEGFKQLEENFADFENLKIFEDEAFISAFLQAFRYALLNHNEENLQSLRNAVLNSALPISPDEISQKMFIQWAGELTGWHIRILRLFDQESSHIPIINLNDPEWITNTAVNYLVKLIESKYPEMTDKYDLYMQIIIDLHSKNLITNLSPKKNMSTRIDRHPTISSIGKRFLSFITSPI